MGPVGQKISRMSIVEYILAYHDRYEYRISWLSYFTQKRNYHSCFQALPSAPEQLGHYWFFFRSLLSLGTWK